MVIFIRVELRFIPPWVVSAAALYIHQTKLGEHIARCLLLLYHQQLSYVVLTQHATV